MRSRPLPAPLRQNGCGANVHRYPENGRKIVAAYPARVVAIEKGAAFMLFQDGERVVFAGDSVTDMGSDNPVGEGLSESLGQGYVREIENLLVAWYPERNIRVTNSGVSGNTSRDLAARFDRDVVALHPDWVSICIGINDVWRQFDLPTVPEAAVLPDAYEANLEAMIGKIKGSVKGIFLLTPYYIETSRADAMRRRMDEYGAICKKLAAKHGLYLVDFQAMFDDFCQKQHSSRVSWDRVHPNKMGAMLLAKAFLQQVDFDYTR